MMCIGVLLYKNSANKRQRLQFDSAVKIDIGSPLFTAGGGGTYPLIVYVEPRVAASWEALYPGLIAETLLGWSLQSKH
jgi:hypothetical protein